MCHDTIKQRRRTVDTHAALNRLPSPFYHFVALQSSQRLHSATHPLCSLPARLKLSQRPFSLESLTRLSVERTDLTEVRWVFLAQLQTWDILLGCCSRVPKQGAALSRQQQMICNDNVSAAGFASAPASA